MSDGTAISWTDATWSPVTGCTKVSDGCTHCYIDRTPPFRMQHRKFNGTEVGATTGVKLHPERLGVPMKWRKSRRVFVCSLADLFQDEVPDRFIAEVFAVMSLASQHSFQVLTKRHARLRSLLNSPTFWATVSEARVVRGFAALPDGTNTLPNAWIGVSTENQKWADIRIPALLDTPAAVRWISAEPLLGPIDLSKWLGLVEWPECWNTHAPSAECSRCIQPTWIVCGGESGPKARPMHPQWARGLRDQCIAAEVAYHFKQFGQHAPVADQPRLGDQWLAIDGAAADWKPGDGHIRRGGGDYLWPGSRTTLVRRARSKHDAGRELDGRTWDQYPTAPMEVSA